MKLSPPAASALLPAIISVVLFIIAVRTKHPIVIGGAIAVMVYTYLRFRINYALYKRRRRKLKRQEDSINVDTKEMKEKDSIDV